MRPVKVTIDTNVLLGTLQDNPQSKSCREIIRLAQRRLIDLSVTPMVDMDDATGQAMGLVMQYKREGVLTETRPAHRPRYANPAAPPPIEPDEKLETDIIKCLKPEAGRNWRLLKDNDQKDVDHLMSHKQNGRHLFITCETGRGGMWRKRACLRRLGIRVTTPNGFIRARGGWQRCGS